MEIYAVQDIKAATFNTPFFQPTDVHALRAFKAEVNRADNNNMMYLYSEDFALWHIGTYEEKKRKNRDTDSERKSRTRNKRKS